MLTISEIANTKLKEILAQQTEPAFGLRVHAMPGGCCGSSYGMSIAEKAEADDWVGEFDGVKVVVDPASAALLEGAAIDFRETLQASGFTITNSNTAPSGGCGSGSCGCGGH